MDYSLFIGLARARRNEDGTEMSVVVDDANPSHHANVCKLWPDQAQLQNTAWVRVVEFCCCMSQEANCCVIDLLSGPQSSMALLLCHH